MRHRFPGGVGISAVDVYRDATLGGCDGGTPHLHTLCTEAYIATAGAGAVETLDASGGNRWDVTAGVVVWFSPGVIHRALASDGGLQVTVIMQNGGLPEAGDAVMTLPSPYWSDLSKYDTAVTIDADSFDGRREQADARRELASAGFAELQERGATPGEQGLAPFYDFACTVVTRRLDRMASIFARSAEAEVARTRAQIEALHGGNPAHLFDGRAASTAPLQTPAFGMCGMLQPYREDGG